MANGYAGVLPGVAGPDLQDSARPAAHASHAPAQTLRQLLGEVPFRDALVRERKRADRLDTKFAVLLVDRGDCPSGFAPWIPIARAVASVSRDVDVAGWLERGSVLGLLVSDAADRQSVLDATYRLRGEISKRLRNDALAGLSIRAYFHGGEAGTGRGTMPSVDLLLEGLVPSRRHPLRDAAKRIFDVIGSLGLLLFFSPVLLAVFAAVKWTSPGPALFRQLRVGQRGRPFTMLKFRTMYVNCGDKAHQDYVTWFIKSSGKQAPPANQVFKLTNDARITRVGRILRRTSLDELPQFLNVLRGEMSLVGPRPSLPFEVEQYQPWHRRRVLDAKPGVTGLWQVYGRSRTTFDEMVRLDLRYARTHTLWTDIRLLAATPRAMFTGKGAV